MLTSAQSEGGSVQLVTIQLKEKERAAFSEELAKAIERNTTAVDVGAGCVFVLLDRLNCDVGNDGPVVVFQG